jgi:hypothetical protein
MPTMASLPIIKKGGVYKSISVAMRQNYLFGLLRHGSVIL